MKIDAVILDNEWIMVKNDWEKSAQIATYAGIPLMPGADYKKLLSQENSYGISPWKAHCRSELSTDDTFTEILNNVGLEPTKDRIRTLAYSLEELTTDADLSAQEAVQWLKDKGIPVYMLSNCSVEINTGNRKRHNYFDMFDETYFSFEIGTRKPELTAYQHVIDQHDLQGKRVLFIDDKQENLVAAEKAGLIPVYHKIGEGTIKERLKEWV